MKIIPTGSTYPGVIAPDITRLVYSQHTKKHTPRHAPAASSRRYRKVKPARSARKTKDQAPSHASGKTRQDPSDRVDEKLTSLPTYQLSSSLVSLLVRTRHVSMNLGNNDDCIKNLHWINPSAPAAQEDQVKLHESGDATTPLQDATNIESGSGTSNTGLMTLEERFEGLEVDWPATDDRPTSREFALATEVEGNLRIGDMSDGEDIE